LSQIADPVEAAKKLGNVEIIYSDASHLQLDMDSGEIKEDVLRLLIDQKVISAESPFVSTSRNGRKHAYIRLRKFLSLEGRIALQAALGSDPLKETFGTIRGESVLFETKDEAPRVMRWLAQGLPASEADAA
jgi:hypothetical protein